MYLCLLHYKGFLIFRIDTFRYTSDNIYNSFIWLYLSLYFESQAQVYRSSKGSLVYLEPAAINQEV